MTRRRSVALALGFSVLFVLGQGVLGLGTEKKISSSFSADLLVSAGDYRAYIVHLAPGDKMNLNVRVGLGEEIDVYTMSMAYYNDYKIGAQLFSSYPQYSKENLKYFVYTDWFTPASEGDYVVVIDNMAKTTSGAPGASDVSCTVKIDLQYKTPFPWMLVFGAIAAIVAVAVVVFAVAWMNKKRADVAEIEAQKKRAENAKLRPIFIQQPGTASGAPAMHGTPSMQAPPPSSSCKSCPHVYDPTSANCIACEYR